MQRLVFRLRLSAFLIICWFSVLHLACATENSCPQINLKFSLQARDFLANYPDSSIQELGRKIPEKLSDICSQWYPYATFTTIDSDQTTPGIGNQLTIIAFGEDYGHSVAQRILLRFEGTIGSNIVDFAELGRIRLFETWEPQPTQQPKVLLAAIGDSLDAYFRNMEFRRTIENLYFSRIPLTDTLRPIDDLRRMAIPQACSTLRVDIGSIFAVDWKSQEDSIHSLPSHMELELSDVENGELLCIVNSFKCGPVILNGPPYWSDSINISLKSIVNGSLRIYLKYFRRNPIQSNPNGLVIGID
jgi:hypothetical protein